MSAHIDTSARNAEIIAACSAPNPPTFEALAQRYGISGGRVSQIARRAGVRKVPVIIPVEWTPERRAAAAARSKARWDNPNYAQAMRGKLHAINRAKTIIWCVEMDATLKRCYETMRYIDFRLCAPRIIGVSETTMLKRFRELGLARRGKS